MKNIAVAISGGIDSTASLLKLLDEGHNVIGLTMILTDSYKNNDSEKAKTICTEYGIKHYYIDLSKVFREKIIKYFINEYLSARTPNPCLICNPIIKFGILREYAKKLGYPYIATGHYARLININNDTYIRKGIDTKKDQSYFISRINPKDLNNIIFPLGEFTKEQVKLFLQNKGIDIVNQKESQEICFIPDDNYKQFINNYINDNDIQKGDILDENGNKVGTHNGIPYYTIGQRRGVNVALGKPVYIRELDYVNNTIIIGNKKKSKKFEAISPIWHYQYEDIKNKQLNVKIRYRGKSHLCKIINYHNDRVTVELDSEVESITPGQGSVFYMDDIVVLSCIIDNVL